MLETYANGECLVAMVTTRPMSIIRLRDWLTDTGRNCELTSLPVQCAYADKLNCPTQNNFQGQIAQNRAPIGL